MPGCWGLILARAGSQRLPGKSMRPLCGKPMAQYTMEAARAASSLSQQWLFTDDPDVIKLGQQLGVQLPTFDRPTNLSQAGTTTWQTVRYFLDQFPEAEWPNCLVLLQSTSPLRTSKDIDDAVAQFQQTPDCDLLISVYEPEKPLHWVLQRNKGNKLEPAFTQATPPLAFPNGALYIVRPELLRTHPEPSAEIPALNVQGFQMPATRSVDIDTLTDFQLAEWSLTQAKKGS